MTDLDAQPYRTRPRVQYDNIVAPDESLQVATEDPCDRDPTRDGGRQVEFDVVYPAVGVGVIAVHDQREVCSAGSFAARWDSWADHNGGLKPAGDWRIPGLVVLLNVDFCGLCIPRRGEHLKVEV